MHAAAKSSFKMKSDQTNLAPELRFLRSYIYVLPAMDIYEAISYRNRSEFLAATACQSQALPAAAAAGLSKMASFIFL